MPLICPVQGSVFVSSTEVRGASVACFFCLPLALLFITLSREIFNLIMQFSSTRTSLNVSCNLFSDTIITPQDIKLTTEVAIVPVHIFHTQNRLKDINLCYAHILQVLGLK